MASVSTSFLIKPPKWVFCAQEKKNQKMLLSEPFAAKHVLEKQHISVTRTLQYWHARSVEWSMMCTPNQVVLASGWWTHRSGGSSPVRLSHIHRCLLALLLYKERRLSKCRNRQIAPEEKQERDTSKGHTKHLKNDSFGRRILEMMHYWRFQSNLFLQDFGIPHSSSFYE